MTPYNILHIPITLSILGLDHLINETTTPPSSRFCLDGTGNLELIALNPGYQGRNFPIAVPLQVVAASLKFSQQPGSNPGDLPRKISEASQFFGGGAQVFYGPHKSKTYSANSTEEAYPSDGEAEKRTTVAYQPVVKKSLRNCLEMLTCNYWSSSAPMPTPPSRKQAKKLLTIVKQHALYHKSKGNFNDLGGVDVETNVGALAQTGGPGVISLLQLGVETNIFAICGDADEPPALRIVGQVPGEAYAKSSLNNVELISELNVFSGSGQLQEQYLPLTWVMMLNPQGMAPANMQCRHFRTLVAADPDTGSPVSAYSPTRVDYSLLWNTGPDGTPPSSPWDLDLVPGARNANKLFGATKNSRSIDYYGSDGKLEECPAGDWGTPKRIKSSVNYGTRLEAHLATAAAILRLGPVAMLKKQTERSYERTQDFVLLGANGDVLESDEQVLLGDWLYRILGKLYGTAPFVVIAMAYLNHLVYGDKSTVTRLGIKKETAPSITKAPGGLAMVAGLRHPTSVPAMAVAMKKFIEGSLESCCIFAAFMKARAKELEVAAGHAENAAFQAKLHAETVASQAKAAAADDTGFAALLANAELKEKSAIAQRGAHERARHLAEQLKRSGTVKIGLMSQIRVAAAKRKQLEEENHSGTSTTNSTPTVLVAKAR